MPPLGPLLPQGVASAVSSRTALASGARCCLPGQRSTVSASTVSPLHTGRQRSDAGAATALLWTASLRSDGRSFSASSRSLARHHEHNHYKTLGVPHTADAKEIKDAFYKLSKEHHPDLNPDSPTAHSTFVKISEAYEVLSDPLARRDYDLSLPSSFFGRSHRPTGTGFGPRRNQYGHAGYTGPASSTAPNRGFDRHDRFHDHADTFRDARSDAQFFRAGGGAAGGQRGASGGAGFHFDGGAGAASRPVGPFDFAEHQRQHYGEEDFDTTFERTEHRRKQMKEARDRRNAAAKAKHGGSPFGDEVRPAIWAAVVVGTFAASVAMFKWNGIHAEGLDEDDGNRTMVPAADRGESSRQT